MRATTAVAYKLPEPPADPAALAGWEREVRRAAYCADPVRLAGRIEQADKRSEHPRLFVTFTAPSFGAVRAKRVHPGNGNLLPCHPRDPNARCPHGRKAACWYRQPEAELRTLGRPLCDDCFDWSGLALWNALAPELWRRTLGVTIYRALAHLLSLSEAEVKRLVRVRYMKVAEYQARGAIISTSSSAWTPRHLERDPEQVAPPPAGFCAELPAEAVKAAAATVAVPYPESTTLPVGWPAGASSSTCANVSRDGTELSAEAVAAYIAKYATKSTEALVGVPGTDAGAAISLPASGRGRGKLEECAAVRSAEPAG